MAVSLPLFTSCTEDEATPIENNLDTDTRINTPSTDTTEPSDSADTLHGVIHDWDEGKAGKVVPMENAGGGSNEDSEGGAA